MATKIQWTDESWNPVVGCTKVSEGCKYCWGESIAKRFWGDRKFTDVRCHPERLDQPLHWRKPRRIFVVSMGDLFHEAVPFEFIDEVFEAMFTAPQHIYQILTKRPKQMAEYFSAIQDGWIDFGENRSSPPPFVWLGASVENQKAADERIPILLQIPAAVRFVSFEPLLESIYMPIDGVLRADMSIDWAIIGCESGPKRRPCKLKDVRNLVNQCQTASVPVFVKQLSINGKVSHDMSEWPEDLRIREYPKPKEK